MSVNTSRDGTRELHIRNPGCQKQWTPERRVFSPAEKPSTGCLVSSASWRRRRRVLEGTLEGVPVRDMVRGAGWAEEERSGRAGAAGIDATFREL